MPWLLKQSRIRADFDASVILVKFLQIVFAEIAPVIIRGYVCLYRQHSLCFVQQDLEDNITVCRAGAVEYQLNIRSHGKHQTSPPAILLQVLKIISLQVKTIDTQQTSQWQHDSFMAIAQLNCSIWQLQTTVSILNYLAQQVAL